MLVPVTMRALIQRINRKLRSDYKQLCVSRGWRLKSNLGDYYILDTYRNVVVDHHTDPKALGKELGALAEYEALSEDD